MEKIALVTVDYNNHKDTFELLKSAEKLVTKNFEARWFIVDNGSGDYLGDSLPDNSKYEILQTGKNLGFAGGYNFGMKYALAWGADYIFAINNDTLAGDPEILIKLVNTLKKKKKAALVSPKILFAPGFEFHKDRYTNAEAGKVIWYGGGYIDWDNVFGKNRGIDEVDSGQYDSVEKVDFVSGCCFMLKASAVESSGLFNENLFAYFEDVDLMTRLTALGYKLYYNGKTQIYHKVSQTSGVGSATTDYLITRNRLYFGFKYASIKTRLALLKESVRLWLWGRDAQKQGITDFYKERYGPYTEPVGLKSPKYPLELSIVIVNYKTRALTLKLLDTIFSDKSGFDKNKCEVIVLDNASDDGIGEFVKRKFPQVKFIQNKTNTGFSRGYNKAISFSKGKYILMLNSDIEVLPGALTAMLAEAKKWDDKAVVAGKLFLTDGTVQNSCFKLPTVNGAIKEYFFNVKNAFSMYHPNADKSVTVEGAVMASYLIPRPIWNEVGELSEGSFMYFEDIEYCRRLKERGYKIYYCPDAKFIHHHGASSKKIGNKAHEYLKKGSVFYHGRIKYLLLWLVLWLGQKIKTITHHLSS